MKKRILVVFLIFFIFFFSTQMVYAKNEFIKTETKNKIIFIEEDEGKFLYSWIFNKKDFENKKRNFDLDINFESNKQKEINRHFKNNVKKKVVSFKHHGKLPATATIKVPVDDKFEDGNNLSLYYYDETKDEMKLLDKNITVVNGYANFDITHCSDYVLALSIAKNTSKNNSNSTIIIGMLFIIVFLVGYTITKNNK